tara:strand:+ start:4031 stop:4204 length:174 start_codon:yes stop_codon:yes gene_type:complete
MKNQNQGDLNRPRMLVTQEKFDAASQEQRERFNYAVEEETVLELPMCCTPVSEPEND